MEVPCGTLALARTSWNQTRLETNTSDPLECFALSLEKDPRGGYRRWKKSATFHSPSDPPESPIINVDLCVGWNDLFYNLFQVLS